MIIKDEFEGWDVNQMKTQYIAHNIMRDLTNYFKLTIGDEPNLTQAVERRTNEYRSYKWSYDIIMTYLTVKDDWYEKVHLNGISKARYNNLSTIVLDARPLNTNRVRADLRIPDMELYSVLIPVKVEGGRAKLAPVRRFMCVVPTTAGAICFAGQSENRAASSLKKNLMTEMKRQMGL